jgi:hypothetical protein
MRQKIVIGLIVLAVVIAAYFIITSSKRASENTQNTEQNPENSKEDSQLPGDPTTSNTLDTSKDSIAVSTQLAGKSMTVDNAILTSAGFIVIHKIDIESGKIGEIIAQSNYLTAGQKQDLEITANLVSGSSYMAELHADTDGDKKFDSAKDMKVKINNLPVMAMFSVAR